MALKIDVRADFFKNGDIVPISLTYNCQHFKIDNIIAHFKNEYSIYEIKCEENIFTIIFDGNFWYLDGDNWKDYMGVRKKSL